MEQLQETNTCQPAEGVAGAFRPAGESKGAAMPACGAGSLKRLFWLFAVNLYISAFTFGGGYVVIPMIRKFFVSKRKLFTESELLDMAAVSQSAPGAIAINLSVLSGYRTAGFLGALASCAGAVLPPLLILSAVTVCYDAFRSNLLLGAALNGMKAGAAALVADVVVDMTAAVRRERKPLFTLLIPAAFCADFFLHINVAVIIVSAAVFGAASVLSAGRKEKRNDARHNS